MFRWGLHPFVHHYEQFHSVWRLSSLGRHAHTQALDVNNTGFTAQGRHALGACDASCLTTTSLCQLPQPHTPRHGLVLAQSMDGDEGETYHTPLAGDPSRAGTPFYSPTISLRGTSPSVSMAQTRREAFTFSDVGSSAERESVRASNEDAETHQSATSQLEQPQEDSEPAGQQLQQPTVKEGSELNRPNEVCIRAGSILLLV